MKLLSYCVYVLLSLKDSKFYIGSTSSLPQRLKDHEAGRNTSTKNRRPFILVFCEYYLSKSDMIRREKYLKTSVGKKGLKLMIRKTLVDLGL